MRIEIQQLQLKEGVSKDGRPWTKIGIFDGKRWYGCFQNKDNKHWKKGDVIEAEVQERHYEGKIFYDLKVKTQLDRIEEKLVVIADYLHRLSLNGNLGGAVKTPAQPSNSAPSYEQPPLPDSPPPYSDVPF